MVSDRSTREYVDRIIALQTILQSSRHGTVDGVEVDLRHPDLDPEQWGCSTSGLIFADLSELIFPWVQRVPLKLRLKREREKFRRNPKIPDDTLEGRLAWEKSQFEREVVVTKGDKLRVIKVEKVATGGPLDPLDDQEMRNAFVEVVHASGKRSLVPSPIEFYRHGSFGANGRITLEKVARRICQAFYNEPGYLNPLENIFAVCLCAWKLVEATTGEFSEDEESFAENLLTSCQYLVQDREALIAAVAGQPAREFPRVWPGGAAHHLRQRDLSEYQVSKILDAAVGLGYLWAKFEAEQNIVPLARHGLARKQSAVAGGKLSGKVRREKAKAAWQALVIVDAKALRARNPSWSQDKLALEISFRHDSKVPGVRTIKGFVSKMEKVGDLPPRK